MSETYKGFLSTFFEMDLYVLTLKLTVKNVQSKWHWLNSNRDSLVLEATVPSTVPQSYLVMF